MVDLRGTWLHRFLHRHQGFRLRACDLVVCYSLWWPTTNNHYYLRVHGSDLVHHLGEVSDENLTSLMEDTLTAEGVDLWLQLIGHECKLPANERGEAT